MTEPVFRWALMLRQGSAICDVPGVGRLQARRDAFGPRFSGLINGNLEIIGSATLESAQRALEDAARRKLGVSP